MMFEDKDWCTPNRQSTNMACLEMFLQAGANPNFDEGKEGRDDELRYPGGGGDYSAWFSDNYYLIRAGTFSVFRIYRFSSGLNGVFLSFVKMLEISNNSGYQAQQSVELLGQICRLLLRHGSNPNHINVHGTTPLHDLMKLWALGPRDVRYRLLPLCQIQSILLSYGADPNKTTPNAHSSMVPLLPMHHDDVNFEVPMDSYPVHYYTSSWI